jgi:hypothetical protein
VNNPLRAHDHGMPTAGNARITVELESGADPIRGSIEHPDGSCRAFWGWLELIDQLRRAAANEPERTSPPTQADPRHASEPDPRANDLQRRTTTEEQRKPRHHAGRRRRHVPDPARRHVTADRPARTSRMHGVAMQTVASVSTDVSIKRGVLSWTAGRARAALHSKSDRA